MNNNQQIGKKLNRQTGKQKNRYVLLSSGKKGIIFFYRDIQLFNGRVIPIEKLISKTSFFMSFGSYCIKMYWVRGWHNPQWIYLLKEEAFDSQMCGMAASQYGASRK